MPSRVTPYLGGTGQDNRGKMNVHPSLQRVSFGADVLASANVQIFGNSFANTSEASTTRFGNVMVGGGGNPVTDLQIIRNSTGTVGANITNNNAAGSSRLDMVAGIHVFSHLFSSVSAPYYQITHSALMSNVYLDIDSIYFRNRGGNQRGLWNNTGLSVGAATAVGSNVLQVQGNVYIDGNVVVTGVTTLVNSVVVSETANAYTANAYFLTKFSSNINPSNGVSFLNSNVALFSYGGVGLELDNVGGILLPSNSYIAANGSIGIGTRSLSGANLNILSSSGVILKARRAGGNGDLDFSFTGIGNGDGITWQHSPASAASPTLGYQFLTADGTRRVQAVTINRFGNVSVGDQTLNMANLSVSGNAYVSSNVEVNNALLVFGGKAGFGTINGRSNVDIVNTLTVSNSSATSTAVLQLYSGSNVNMIGLTGIGAGSGQDLVFKYNDTTDLLRLVKDGNLIVGTSTTSPTKLRVEGNVYTTGNTEVGGHFAVSSPVITNYATFGSSSGILANNLSSDNKFESRRAGGQTWSLQHDTSQVYTWMNSKKGILQTNAGLVQIYGNDILALASNARGDLAASGNVSAVNMVVSNCFIGGYGALLGLSTGYLTIATTGFFSSDTSGQFLFRNSSQVKGGTIDVGTTNANAFTFLHMSGAQANVYANMFTASGNLIVASNATIGNNFISESAAAFGSKSTGGANLFVMGSTYLQNRAGQDGNEVFQMRISSGTVGAQHAVYSGNYDIATGSGFDINLSSGKGVNPSWAGNNGMFFKGGTTVKHAMDNTKLAIGYTTVQAANVQVLGNVFSTTGLETNGIIKQFGNTIVDLAGNFSNARWNSGSGASYLTYLRGDGTWATPAGGGGSGGGWLDGAAVVYLNNVTSNVSVGTATDPGVKFAISNSAPTLYSGLYNSNTHQNATSIWQQQANSTQYVNRTVAGTYLQETPTAAIVSRYSDFDNHYLRNNAGTTRFYLGSGGLAVIGGATSLTDSGLTVQAADGNGGVLESWNTGLTGAGRRTWGVALEQGTTGDWNLFVSTAANTKPSIARLTMTLDGKFGVNTSVPVANLHVTGNAHVTTNITSSANVVGQQLTANNGFLLNSNTLVANYTVAAGYNAVTVGPFTVPASLNVTVATGARWVIL